MLAMDVNDYAWGLILRVVLRFIASMLAPTGDSVWLSGRQTPQARPSR